MLTNHPKFYPQCCWWRWETTASITRIPRLLIVPQESQTISTRCGLGCLPGSYQFSNKRVVWSMLLTICTPFGFAENHTSGNSTTWLRMMVCSFLFAESSSVSCADQRWALVVYGLCEAKLCVTTEPVQQSKVHHFPGTTFSFLRRIEQSLCLSTKA